MMEEEGEVRKDEHDIMDGQRRGIGKLESETSEETA